jgi:uncharacterized membrane protein
MLGILLVNWALSLAGLAQQSMWIDERVTVQDVSPAWHDFVPSLIQAERRPPLYWVLLKVWGGLAGQSELAMRFFSVATTSATVALTFTLTRKLAGQRAGLIAAGLIGFSPFLLLYGRMIRSYALFAFLAGVATWSLIRLATHLTIYRWLIYVGLAIALLYTDYGAVVVLGIHGLWLLKDLRDSKEIGNTVKRLGGLALAGMTFVPWLGILLVQTRRDLIKADLSQGGLGLILKLVFPLASLGAGETIYPWHPLAALSIAACGLLALMGFLKIIQRQPAYGWLLVGWFGLSLIFTATLLSTVAPDITFLNMVSRTPHVVIAYDILIAAGIAGLKSTRWRVAALTLITMTFALAIFNYYTGREFHNPIYALPTRQIVEQVRTQSTASDLIIADDDTLFGYYYLKRPGLAVYQDTDFDTNRATVEAQHPAHIWLITFGRDRTASMSDAKELAEWLESRYIERSREGYGEVKPSYRWVKERLLHRPVYRYKLLVQRYER